MRGFNIEGFRSAMRYEPAKPNLFLTEFFVPPSLTGLGGYGGAADTVRALEFWVEGTAWPGIGLQTYLGQQYGYGVAEQRPFMNHFGDLPVDVIFDGVGENHQFFMRWMQSIINFEMQEGPNNGRTLNLQPMELQYKIHYVADVNIYLYTRETEQFEKLTLRDAFPKAIGDIRLAWADNNTYMRLPIQLAFTDWQLTDLSADEVPQTPPLK